MKTDELKFETIEIAGDRETAFDIESWLADLLVDYWLSDKRKEGKHNNDA